MRVVKLLFILLLATVLFGFYTYFFRQSEAFAVEVPGPAGILEHPTPNLPERVIAQAGPQGPVQASNPHDAPVRIPPPSPNDPYAQSFQNSDFGDENRAPEKLFNLAPLPTVTDVARESGVASNVLNGREPAVEKFNPEGLQNGGEFMEGGIFPYDKDESVNFSEF